MLNCCQLFSYGSLDTHVVYLLIRGLLVALRGPAPGHVLELVWGRGRSQGACKQAAAACCSKVVSDLSLSCRAFPRTPRRRMNLCKRAPRLPLPPSEAACKARKGSRVFRWGSATYRLPFLRPFFRPLANFDIWGLANVVSNTVKARTEELVKSVQQTDWKAELMAFSKEAAEEGKTLSHKTAELVEHLPEQLEKLPEQVGWQEGALAVQAALVGEPCPEPMLLCAGRDTGIPDSQTGNKQCRGVRHPAQRGRLPESLWAEPACGHQGAH